jgi:hypothetical protein
MSRDIKGTSVDAINDGVERAVRRCKDQLHKEISNVESNAVRKAVNAAKENIKQTQKEINSRMDSINKSLINRIESTQRQLGARIDEQAQRTAEELQKLDYHHTKALLDLSDSVFDAIEAQNVRIDQEMIRIDQNIGALSKGLKSVNDGMRKLAESTDRRFNQQQQQITEIQGNIKRIFESQENDRNAKLLAAGTALALLDAIRERTEVDRFAPQHMLDSIALKEERLRSIANNPDACTITDANNLIDEALVLENEAIRRRNEWEPLHNAALSSALAVLQLLEQSETIKVPSLYEQSEEELKTDYWTHGRYSETLREIRQIKEKIEKMPVDKERLQILHTRVNELQHQSENLIIEAAELGTLSEQRVIISNDVLDAMIRQGWELKGDPDFLGGEEDSDWREGTFAVLSKPGTGEEVSILVLPEDKNGKMGNQIVFHRNDDLKESASNFQTRMEEIKREIEKSGYILGALREPKHGGDGKINQLRSPKEMQSKGAAQKLQKTLSAK